MALAEPKENIDLPTPIEQQSCDNCFYSRVRRGLLECHYDPPMATGGNKIATGWVQVEVGDWCGKWSSNK